jgi:hypothetical protein
MGKCCTSALMAVWSSSSHFIQTVAATPLFISQSLSVIKRLLGFHEERRVGKLRTRLCRSNRDELVFRERSFGLYTNYDNCMQSTCLQKTSMLSISLSLFFFVSLSLSNADSNGVLPGSFEVVALFLRFFLNPRATFTEIIFWIHFLLKSCFGRVVEDFELLCCQLFQVAQESI